MEMAAYKAVPVAAPDKTRGGAELVGRGVSSWAFLFTPAVMNKREEHPFHPGEMFSRTQVRSASLFPWGHRQAHKEPARQHVSSH